MACQCVARSQGFTKAVSLSVVDESPHDSPGPKTLAQRFEELKRFEDFATRLWFARRVLEIGAAVVVIGLIPVAIRAASTATSASDLAALMITPVLVSAMGGLVPVLVEAAHRKRSAESARANRAREAAMKAWSAEAERHNSSGTQ